MLFVRALSRNFALDTVIGDIAHLGLLIGFKKQYPLMFLNYPFYIMSGLVKFGLSVFPKSPRVSMRMNYEYELSLSIEYEYMPI